MKALIDYALTHGWDDDDLAALEQALAQRTEASLEDGLVVLGERHCPPVEYCELVGLLLEWYRASERLLHARKRPLGC